MCLLLVSSGKVKCFWEGLEGITLHPDSPSDEGTSTLILGRELQALDAALKMEGQGEG